ncbi:serine hydrolase [Pullulanibacillus sp. KACC 23026]|uniref:serine hydrolase domain-containing protein n=1 Tax=Pullulanibacillus sp. KACC 23026 TaxID=3028315 RepID=UPI0023B02FDD|nr:serine hydrolase domain-containing protein [Pullulanibacillus sp. KACC 23026]WEG11176.1 serine hydrolase [Pullulanibacillus sp. KACC 23026]
MTQLHRLTPLFKRFVDNGPAGCACTVVRQGETLYEEYFGYADLDNQKAIQEDTIYRIYSMTKLVTCVAALMLYERGFYQLNDPLDEYLPEFKHLNVYHQTENGYVEVKRAAGPVLIKHLFSMSSGLSYGGKNSEIERQTETVMTKANQGKNLRELTKELAAVPLAFDPGARWRYGTSHDVLGALIEVVSGQSFGEFLKHEIFEPLEMKDTSFRLSEEKRERLCTMYHRDTQGNLTPITDMDQQFQTNYQYENGGGGLLSTLGDYTRFAQMLANGGALDGARILSPFTINLMRTNHLNSQQLTDFANGQHQGYGYGLGVRVMMDPAAGGSNSSIGEFGWAGMAGSWVLMDPKEKLSIVYMQQMLPSLEPYFHNRLRNVVYGGLERI